MFQTNAVSPLSHLIKNKMDLMICKQQNSFVGLQYHTKKEDMPSDDLAPWVST